MNTLWKTKKLLKKQSEVTNRYRGYLLHDLKTALEILERCPWFPQLHYQSVRQSMLTLGELTDNEKDFILKTVRREVSRRPTKVMEE